MYLFVVITLFIYLTLIHYIIVYDDILTSYLTII